MIPLYAGLVISYLAGSIPAALIAGLLLGGVDIRTVGSGNAGATNLYRVFGIKPYVVVLFFDLGKGYFAASLIASWIKPGALDPLQLSILCGLAAVLGHVYTVFAGFKGGKGVITAAGVMLAIVPGPLFVAFLFYAVITGLTHYVSLGSIGAAFSVPITLLSLYFTLGWTYRMEIYMISFLMVLIILFTHRKNIGRLLRGEETKTYFLKKD